MRLCEGYLGADSESEDEEDGDVVSSGEERGSGRGERRAWVPGIALVVGREGGLGETERRFSTACAGRGLVGGNCLEVIVVFADEVRENGGAIQDLVSLVSSKFVKKAYP